MPPERRPWRRVAPEGPVVYAVRDGADGSFCLYDNWTQTHRASRGRRCRMKRFHNEVDACIFLGLSSVDDPRLQRPVAAALVVVPSGPNVVATDGGCLSVGTVDAVGGVGVFYGRDDPRNISLRLPGPGPTNNRAELLAALLGLLGFGVDAEGQILTDSQYTINAVTDADPRCNVDLVHLLQTALRDRPGVTLVKVPGHAGHELNEGADALATAAMGMLAVVPAETA